MSDNEKTGPSKYGLLIPVALAGTIAGVSILFALAASHGGAFSGITQLLTPQLDSRLGQEEKKEDGSGTNLGPANREQETKVTAVEVKPEQELPPTKQENKVTSQDKQPLPIGERVKSTPRVTED